MLNFKTENYDDFRIVWTGEPVREAGVLIDPTAAAAAAAARLPINSSTSGCRMRMASTTSSKCLASIAKTWAADSICLKIWKV